MAQAFLRRRVCSPEFPFSLGLNMPANVIFQVTVSHKRGIALVKLGPEDARLQATSPRTSGVESQDITPHEL